MSSNGSLGRLCVDTGLTIVDIGARGGQFGFGNLAWVEPWTRYVAFEPDPEAAPAAAVELRDRHSWRDVTLVPYALATQRGTAQLTITEQPGLSSLLEPDLEVAGAYYSEPFYEPRQRIDVPTMTLDEAAREYRFEEAAFIKLDTQGTELDIMQSGIGLLENGVLAVLVEVEFQPFYTDQPLFGDVDCFLREHGYRIATLDRTHLRRSGYDPEIYSRRELVWGHALYLRRFETLPQSLDLGKFVTRAAALYTSFDLMDLALELLDSPAARASLNDAERRACRDELHAYAARRTQFLRCRYRGKRHGWVSKILDHTSTDKSKPFTT